MRTHPARRTGRRVSLVEPSPSYLSPHGFRDDGEAMGERETESARGGAGIGWEINVRGVAPVVVVMMMRMRVEV